MSYRHFLSVPVSKTQPPRSIHGVELISDWPQRGCENVSATEFVSELCEQLMRCDSSEDRQAVTRGALLGAGFEWMEYGVHQFENRQLRPRILFSGDAPADWLERYCAEKLWAFDHRLNPSQPWGVPALWSVPDLLSQERNQPQPQTQVLRFLRHLQSIGVNGGMTLRLPLSDFKEVAVVNLLSSRIDVVQDSRQKIARGWVAALGVHEYFHLVRQVVHERSEPILCLTTQQFEIAQGLVRGLSDKAIARELNISTHAVDYHLRHLRSKFGVNNRVQLARAIEQLSIPRVSLPEPTESEGLALIN